MPAETPLDRLRARRRALGEKKTIDLEVPGYDGELVVRFRWVAYEELAKAGRRLQAMKDTAARDVFAACDTLALACEDVLMNVDGELKTVAEDGEPVRFGDDRLGVALGFEPSPKVRQNVRAVFENDYAVLTTAARLSAWLADASQEVDGAFVGESVA